MLPRGAYAADNHIIHDNFENCKTFSKIYPIFSIVSEQASCLQMTNPCGFSFPAAKFRAKRIRPSAGTAAEASLKLMKTEMVSFP